MVVTVTSGNRESDCPTNVLGGPQALNQWALFVYHRFERRAFMNPFHIVSELRPPRGIDALAAVSERDKHCSNSNVCNRKRIAHEKLAVGDLLVQIVEQ